MGSLIDVDALREWIKTIPLKDLSDGRGLCRVIMENDFTKAIKNMPDNCIVDAVPVRHGHWVDAYPDIEPNPMLMYGICSVCGFEQSISNKLKYCPNCGSKMDEEVSK